jgi:hypothetical protein
MVREQPDFSEEFRDALGKVGYAGADLDRIETRKCGTDDYSGVEYEFYGHYVPIRAIIDVITGKDDFAIEEMSYVDESTEENDHEPHLNVFVADLRPVNQKHPAFVGRPY